MPEDPREEVTQILEANADPLQTATRLLPLVYDELRKLARAQAARKAPGQTLQPTALVHEAYMRLVGKADPGWEGKSHFFAAAARAMRDIRIEEARRKDTLKRGGNCKQVDLEEAEAQALQPRHDDLALQAAIERLEQADPRKGAIVNYRYYVGLTAQQTARMLGISVSTVEREWRYISSWLKTQLEKDRNGDAAADE